MKIKRLDIHGFKSFVDKTTLHFSQGVSAIVGPNGCGKSNIVDAIRWVLGEHNARHLRGKHMEDVIFNGSESRKPLGMAEVVMTLSNDQGLAPAEYAGYSEIEVARRLYRSGESEYLINKVQCRLRDVVDLFTDTGVGNRAYAIVEQGKVDWLVNAKPEEKRLIFEEAAGINKYKQRKEAALRRLDSTRQNLVRVNDIIGEVKRQLNSLNRQAKKAERYKTVKEELKDIELFLASGEHSALYGEVGTIEARIEELRERAVGHSAEQAEKGALLEETKRRYLEEEAILKEMREGSFALATSINGREREIELTNVRVKELDRQEGRLLTEIDEITSQREQAITEVDETREDMERLSLAVREGEGSIHDGEERLKGVSEELCEQEGLQRAKKAELMDILTSLSTIKNQLQGYMREDELLHLKVGKSEREREELRRRGEEKRDSLKGMAGDIERLTYEKGEAERGSVDSQVVLDNLEEELSRREESIRETKEELAILSSKLATLKELERNFEGFRDGVKSIMKVVQGEAPQSLHHSGSGGTEAVSGESLRGIRGVFADFIETSSDWERAVEAALGEKLQYIVVENRQDGMAALGYLKSHACGKGTFVPMERSGSGCNGGEAAPTGGERDLLNFVTVKGGYTSVARDLLGDVLLVNNLDEAFAIWNESGGAKSLVTRDGDLIDRAGFITGGSSNGSDSGVLQRRREAKELSSHADDLKQSLQSAEVERETLTGRVREVKEALESFKRDAHTKAIELVNREAIQRGAEDELKRIGERLEVLDFEMREAEEELERIGFSKSELMRERDAAAISQEELEVVIEGLSVEVERLRNEREAALALLTDAKVSLASLRERLEAVRGRSLAKESLIHDLEVRLVSRREECERGKGEVGELHDRGRGLKEELEALLNRREEVRREEVVKEESIASLTEGVSDLEKGLEALRRESGRIEEERSALELKKREVELKSIHLSERMSERYDVAIDSYEPAQELIDAEQSEVESRCEELRERIRLIGEVNLAALEEYAELEERHTFLTGQQEDLTSSMDTLHKTINKINRTTRERFTEAFEAINEKFKLLFPRFFRGGKAELRLVDEGNIHESGIEIVAQPPGKKLQNISLLSGGEKALTATSLIFSIFMVKPTPFCFLDEVDAPLDEANTDRFDGLLREMAEKSQFILITHNKHSMESADRLFGVTMEEPGVSKLVSVQLA
ncbi:MAG: chromosome segregation protein SMC [Thermodesulfobacteriota bacterium]